MYYQHKKINIVIQSRSLPPGWNVNVRGQVLTLTAVFRLLFFYLVLLHLM